MENKEFTISASKLGQFLFCPLSYKYSYVDGEKRDEGDIYTSYGQAIHKVLADNYRQKIQSRKDLLVKDMEEKFANYFSEEVMKLSFGVNQLEFQKMRLEGINVINAYMATIAPTIQPKEVELEFRIPLDKYPITLHGFIDLIDEDNWIEDHKTASKSTKRNWNQNTVNASEQLTFYSAAFRKLFKKEETGVRIRVLPREPKPEFILLKSNRTQAQISELLQLCSKIKAIEEVGIYVPNRNMCRNCKFRPTCDKMPCGI